MRLLVFFAALLQCVLYVLAQSDTKTQRLLDIAKSNKGIVKLTSKSFNQFAEGKRNYGLVVLMTALGDQFRCVPCREFEPEYKLLASGMQQTKDASQIFFGHLDFKDGQEIFQKFRLQTAPNIFYFPPTSKGIKKDPVKYEITKNGLSADPLAAFLSRESGLNVIVRRPFNYLAAGAKLFLLAGVAAVGKLVFSHIGFLLYHRNTWAAISIIIILVMTSGHMWNRIRKPPYVTAAPGGRVNYVANGFSQQLGIEPQIVAAIYGILAFSIVALIVAVPKMDKFRQRIGVYVWTACIVVVFSCLMNLFRAKNGAYPYSILF